MTYCVGQVLYVVMKNKASVFPFVVVEEIVRKTVDGETTSYIVRGGTDPKQTVPITSLEGEVFDSAASAKAELIDRATRSINKLVDAAVQRAQEWYPGSVELPSDAGVKRQSPMDIGTTGDVVELPDGTKARVKGVKLPDSLRG